MKLKVLCQSDGRARGRAQHWLRIGFDEFDNDVRGDATAGKDTARPYCARAVTEGKLGEEQGSEGG